MALPSVTMSASEYLAWERLQPERHEYVRGEVLLMAGGSPRHNALSAALIRDLGGRVRGSPCRVLTSDQRIALRPGEHYVYADASLVCGPLSLADGTADVLTNPRAIFEVLSKRTEAYDRGDKWAAYQRIESLDTYGLVSQSRARVELFRRGSTGWQYEVVEAGGLVAIRDGVVLEADDLYDGVFDLPGD